MADGTDGSAGQGYSTPLKLLPPPAGATPAAYPFYSFWEWAGRWYGCVQARTVPPPHKFERQRLRVQNPPLLERLNRGLCGGSVARPVPARVT